MATIPFLTGINWFGFVAQTSKWIGYGFILLFFAGAIWFFYHMFSFKFRVTVFPLVGSGSSEGLAVGKLKKNRFKWNKDKTAWIALYPLFNKEEIKPFEDKFIYSNNNLVAFKLGEHYLPGCINISKDESADVLSQINPIPHQIQNWGILRLKKNAQEFTKQSWWQENRFFMLTLLTVGACLVMVGLTVYFTYEFAAGGRADISGLTSALKTFGGEAPAG